MKIVKKGEIYLVNLKGEGYIQKGPRPVIISSNNMGNYSSPTVQVIPCTSQLHKSKIPVHVEVGVECGLEKLSIALIEQETTINKDELICKIGACTRDITQKINKAICIQKGIFNDNGYIPSIDSMLAFVG